MKKLIVVLGILVLLVVGAWVGYFHTTKSASPQADVNYVSDGLSIHIFYNSPFKKGRKIFGGLVPYGKVWRTGANEATVLETSKNLNINGKTLKAGKYTIWTIPTEQTWTVIFNSEYGQWGINHIDGEANRNPQYDVLSVEVPVLIQDKEFEKFTISVEKTGEDQELIFIWDKTLISVPFTVVP